MTQQATFKREREVLLQLPAGLDPDGNPVLERVEAYGLDRPGHFELKHSPLFIRNLAAGDVFRLSGDPPVALSVVRRSGQLAVRVFHKDGVEAMERELSPEVEKLGGRLDRRTDRALVYSLHVNVGFAAVETLFDRHMADFPGSVWYYGNVYDPADGMTPLNWWDEFLNQV